MFLKTSIVHQLSTILTTVKYMFYIHSRSSVLFHSRRHQNNKEVNLLLQSGHARHKKRNIKIKPQYIRLTIHSCT